MNILVIMRSKRRPVILAIFPYSVLCKLNDNHDQVTQWISKSRLQYDPYLTRRRLTLALSDPELSVSWPPILVTSVKQHCSNLSKGFESMTYVNVHKFHKPTGERSSWGVLSG